MDNKNTPAFPVNEETTDRIDAGTKIYTGLSKREIYAMAAMQGILAGNTLEALDGKGMFDAIAHDAVAAADALLNELSKTQP